MKIWARELIEFTWMGFGIWSQGRERGGGGTVDGRHIAS